MSRIVRSLRMGSSLVRPLRGLRGIPLQQGIFRLRRAVPRLLEARFRFHGANAQPTTKPDGYDEQPEFTKEIVTSLKPQQVYMREFGSDSSGRGAEDEHERDLGDQMDSYMGVPEDDRVIGGRS